MKLFLYFFVLYKIVLIKKRVYWQCRRVATLGPGKGDHWRQILTLDTKILRQKFQVEHPRLHDFLFRRPKKITWLISAWKEELNHTKINIIIDDFIAKSTVWNIVVFLKNFVYSKKFEKDGRLKYEKNYLFDPIFR